MTTLSMVPERRREIYGMIEWSEQIRGEEEDNEEEKGEEKMVPFFTFEFFFFF